MREGGLDLRFDLEARKQWYWIGVVLQLAEIVRHRLFDVFVSIFVGCFVVDQDLADLIGQVVPQCADN